MNAPQTQPRENKEPAGPAGLLKAVLAALLPLVFVVAALMPAVAAS